MIQAEKSPGTGRIMGGFYSNEIIKKSDGYGYGIHDGIIYGSVRRRFFRIGYHGSPRRDHCGSGSRDHGSGGGRDHCSSG